MTKPTLFHTLAFRDAEAGIAFLTALGFTEVATYRNADHDGTIDHAEYAWPGCGAVMFGSAERPGTADDAWQRRIGAGSCYLVVATGEDVDRIHERALAAGGVSAQAPHDPPYGGRACTVRDPEGNQYSIGTYEGA